ncbi:MAG: PilZ domain-containing protein [Candidatus Methylomirabilales bacterium]
MVRRRKRLQRWFSRESAPEEVQPQASAETPPGVEAESAHLVPDEVRTEPPAEVPEAGVEVPLIAEASDEGELQSAAHEPEGVEVQLPPEAPEETIVQFVAQAPREIEAQAAAKASPEIETLTPEQEAELRDQKSATRRQYARFLVGGKAKGRVTAIYDAVVLNLSIGGSLIEHAHVVRPGTLSFLDLDLFGKRLRLKCRVARSVVHGSHVLPTGERELIYRTGLEFLELSEATRQVIGRYIQSMMNEERG